MENDKIKDITETLSTSLENTQKNATDTETSVTQVLSMSGKEMHEQALTAILTDVELKTAEKLELIRLENENYDSLQENNTNRVIRLQQAQTQNVGAVTNWWTENWGWIVSAGLIILVFGSPQVRTALTTVTKNLAA